MRGLLQKLFTGVQLSVFGVAVVVLFMISLVGSTSGRPGRGWEEARSGYGASAARPQVPYSYVEPSTHSRLWTTTHRLFGSVEHLQLANSYGLFRRMTGLGGRPEVVLQGSYDGHHWTVIAPGSLRGNEVAVRPLARLVR